MKHILVNHINKSKTQNRYRLFQNYKLSVKLEELIIVDSRKRDPKSEMVVKY